MVDSGVPATVEELHEKYDKLILWIIYRTAGRRLSKDEVEEFRQKVYLRVLQYDFLGKARRYFETHEGRFAGSLFTLVRNVVYQRHKREKSDPLASAVGLAELRWPTPAARLVPDELRLRGHEQAVEAGDLLRQIGRRLHSPKRRTQISDFLAAAVEVGLHSKTLADALDAHPSTIRHYLVTIRAEARRLEAPCPALATLTTKSARRSASRALAGRSSSGRPTATPMASA